MPDTPEAASIVRDMLHTEVPEMREGIVEIKALVCRPGRIIVVVHSRHPEVDAVRACVGERGVRVKAVISKLAGERLEIVPWNESREEFVRNLIRPGNADRIEVNPVTGETTIYPVPDQLSLIVGRGGVRLSMISEILGCRVRVAASDRRRE